MKKNGNAVARRKARKTNDAASVDKAASSRDRSLPDGGLLERDQHGALVVRRKNVVLTKAAIFEPLKTMLPKRIFDAFDIATAVTLETQYAARDLPQ